MKRPYGIVITLRTAAYSHLCSRIVSIPSNMTLVFSVRIWYNDAILWKVIHILYTLS